MESKKQMQFLKSERGIGIAYEYEGVYPFSKKG